MYVFANLPETPRIFYGMPIGDIIRKLRKAKGLTQAELAAKVGTLQKVIADYETGTSTPPTGRLVELAKALGASTDELLGLKDAPATAPARNGRPSRRMTKVQKLFNSLQDEEQRVVLKQIESLSQRSKRKKEK